MKYADMRKTTAIILITMMTLVLPVQTLLSQTGAVVTSGAANISQTGNVTNINQSTDRVAINWQTFNIRPEETVNFNQPGASSVTLNRVIGNERSVIEGIMNANGQVFLLNSSGILFTKDASVNTGGLVASTLNLMDEDFNAGRYIFRSDDAGGTVVNQGAITAKDGGYVALLGNTVSNQGIITATKGTVALAGGDRISLDFNGKSLLGVIIDEGTLNALVENRSAIIADGGRVFLTAKAVGELLNGQINTDGLIRARTIDDLTGEIEIFAHGGTATIAGTLDASAPDSGNGGFIETSGDVVKIAEGTVVTTMAENGANGEWLIDPDGFTVGMTANDGDMSAAMLNASLASGKVTIASTTGSGNDGNININGAVNWSRNTLTLNATNNIYVNNVMTATGTAGLTAHHGTGTNANETPMGLYTATGDSGSRIDFTSSGALTINNETYTVINTASQLAAARNNPNGRYVLGSNINMSSISNWTSLDNNAGFTGIFNGLGHSVNSFRNTSLSFFGTIGQNAVVSNLSLIDAVINVTSARNSAGILADVNSGSIVNVGIGRGPAGGSGMYINANINYAGGLVGSNRGLIAQSSSPASVSNIRNTTGGLVGFNESAGRIIDSYTTGSISNTTTSGATGGYVGGFVGLNDGTVQRSFATGGIILDGGTSPSLYTGGFVGGNNGTIRESWTGIDYTSIRNIAPQFGGFAGENTGTIENAYSTRLNGGNTTDSVWNAGFVYRNTGTIRNAYATMASKNTLNTERYGFAWSNSGTLENVYWYADTAMPPYTGQPPARTTEVLPTIDARLLSKDSVYNFSSYNFGSNMSDVWGRAQSGLPVLRNIPVYISTTANISYGNSISSGLTAVGLQGGNVGQRDAISGSSCTLGTGISCNPFTIVNPSGGTHPDTGAWNAADILTGSPYTNVTGVIRINPRLLSISNVVENKVYDGTTDAVLRTNVARGGLQGLVGNETLDINYTSAAFQNKNAGNGVTVNLVYTVSDGTNGGKASNYTIATTTTANITRKAVEVTVTGNDRNYDGTTAATITAIIPGMIAGDDLSINYTSAIFDDRNAGDRNIAVTGIALAGADAGNYTFSGGAYRTTTAVITPLPLNFYGMTYEGSPLEIGAESLTALNIIDGDSVTLSGSVLIGVSEVGSQQIIDFSGLSVNNTNYTAVGSIGSIIVGGANLIPDRVVAGNADIVTSGKTTTVTQTTDKAVIDWMRFSLGTDETLIFNQLSEDSVVLNRVVTSLQSVIDGAMRANGRVFILNANGILFTANSQVNVGGLLAGTFNLATEDFLNDAYVFTVARGDGSVISEGDIVLADGGFAILVGSQGMNHTGTITGGNLTLLASADSLHLTDLNNAEYTVGSLTGAVNIGGTVTPGNGGVFGIAGDTVTLREGFRLNAGNGGAWNWEQNDGITIGEGVFTGGFVSDNLAARDLSLTSKNGSITINNAINWSANTALSLSAGKDIFINKSISATGANAGLTLNTGGDYRLITPATFSGTVFDATGKPVARQIPAGMEYTSIYLGGANARLNIDGNAYTLIRSMDELASINGKTGYFALMNDLDAAAWSRANTGTASVVGTMSGTLAGMGYTVSNLTLNAPDKEYLGLIGNMLSVAGINNTLRDIGVLNADITGERFIGALVGHILGSGARISQAYSTGKIKALGLRISNMSGDQVTANIGGVAGYGMQVNVENSFSDVDITVAVAIGQDIGGLIGGGHTVTIANSHATGNISSPTVYYYINEATNEMVPATAVHNEFRFRLETEEGWSIVQRYSRNIGGLLGHAYFSNIADSYASGNVTAMDGENIGGLAGETSGSSSVPSSVINSFATGNVIGGQRVGGLIGSVSSSSYGEEIVTTVDNVYATGRVIGTRGGANRAEAGLLGRIGGLMGEAVRANISNAFASGDVIIIASGRTNMVGGLVGQFSTGSINDSYATGTIVGNGGEFNSGLVGGGFGNTAGNYYSDVRIEAARETAPLRTEAGRVIDDIQMREEEETRNSVNSAQDAAEGGTSDRRLRLNQYIQYGNSDGYSAYIRAISIEDECSEDDESCK